MCRFGDTCKFDHRCAICGRLGHGAVACNKRGPEKAGITAKKESV